MSQAGFESAIETREWPQPFALDRAATGILTLMWLYLFGDKTLTLLSSHFQSSFSTVRE
jgi:hypothetical protein